MRLEASGESAASWVELVRGEGSLALVPSAVFGMPGWPQSVPRFTGKGIATLTRLAKLTDLSIANNKLTDADVACLGSFKGMRKLSLFAPEVTDRFGPGRT